METHSFLEWCLHNCEHTNYNGDSSDVSQDIKKELED